LNGFDAGPACTNLAGYFADVKLLFAARDFIANSGCTGWLKAY